MSAPRLNAKVDSISTRPMPASESERKLNQRASTENDKVIQPKEMIQRATSTNKLSPSMTSVTISKSM